MLETPIAFLIFNRPEATLRVFEAIRAARPRHLLVIADGPRAGREGEVERCNGARVIAEQIDWPCELLTKYAATNLGCGKCVSQGIAWAFENFPQMIILEDDCLPHPDFFRFCDQLLAHYADDLRVAHVSGDNFHGEAINYPGSYYFSRFAHVWGWATWRRAWDNYDFEMSDWPRLRIDGTMERLFADLAEREFWRRSFDGVHSGQVDTWDIQWAYSLLKNGQLAINPANNLVSNIGFGGDATHTRKVSWMSDLPIHAIGDLQHPESIVEDRRADARTFDVVFDGSDFRKKLSSSGLGEGVGGDELSQRLTRVD